MYLEIDSEGGKKRTCSSEHVQANMFKRACSSEHVQASMFKTYHSQTIISNIVHTWKGLFWIFAEANLTVTVYVPGLIGM